MKERLSQRALSIFGSLLTWSIWAVSVDPKTTEKLYSVVGYTGDSWDHPCLCMAENSSVLQKPMETSQKVLREDLAYYETKSLSYT